MPNISEICVAILAGGFGIRLPLAVPGQKVMAKVRKHSFLEYILDQLNEAGFRRIVICTGYFGDQVQEAFGNNYKSLSLIYSHEQSPLGTAGAVRLALPHLGSDDILVTNGDSFLDTDLRKFLEFHIGKKADGTILLTKVSNTSRYGLVEVDDSNQIIGFEEKKKNGGMGYINGGIYLLKRSLLLKIPKKKYISFEKDIFPEWAGKGYYGFKTKGKFIDIGTPESYNHAEQFFAQHPI